MMELLAGFAGAHGTHGDTDSRPGSVKKEIKKTARTVRDPVTERLWDDHLEGVRPLGIITIREDSTCMWGAVDIDAYDVVHTDVVRALAEKKVPSVVCRTKSGGAHVYVFFSEPVPASEVMVRLRELASAIGHGGSEIFPKQDQVLIDRGDLGNWLNMPYFGADTTSRYAVRPDGRGMSLSEFLRVARSQRMSRRVFLDLVFRETLPAMADAPPCLEHLCSVGIGEGQRNNGLFALGVLAKKVDPDKWETLLEGWNHAYLRPPLPSGEVAAVIKGLKKKAYTYKCSDQPIVSHCNMALCRSRKHGVGAGGGAPVVESVSVLATEPPLFFVNMRTGGTVECNSTVLLSPRDFQRVVLEQQRQVIQLYSLDEWLRHMQKCVESATIIEAPREVSTTGHFEELLERFCTDRHAGETQDDLLLGKPWHDETQGRVWFRLRDLQTMLDRSGFRSLTRSQIVTRIRSMGGGTHFFNLRGKGFNTWFVPAAAMQWQTEGVEVPRGEESPL
jgi:hypothetical protein